MNLYKNVLQKIKSLGLQHQKMLLAVSGGADSMTLLEVCGKIHPNCVVAHVNYNFRPVESKNEETLVRARCESMSIPFFVLHLNGYEELKKNGENNLQIFAREQRYRFFEKIMKEEGCSVLATAHHADDNVETVLLNLIKGTGYRGLKAISILQNNIFRPFIDVPAAVIRHFTQTESISFFEDSSNNSDAYDRNYLRHHVIPTIERRFPDFKKNTLQNIQRFQEVGRFYENYLQARKNVILKQQHHSVYVDLDKLNKESYEDDLVILLLQDYGFSARYLDAFQQLRVSKNAARLTDGKTSFIKDKNRIYIVQEHLEQDIFHFESIQELIGKKLKIAGKLLQFEQVDAQQVDFQGPNTLYIQADRCENAITIRLNKPGDYFYPFGIKKKKKVSRFLADKKMPQTLRRNVLLIFCGNQCIAIAGLEIDYRFAVTSRQAPCIRIRCTDWTDTSH